MPEPRPDVLPWLAEALAKQRMGNLAGALLAYKRVISRDPGIPDAWCNLAGVLHSLGREEEALEAVQRALELAPENPAAHVTLGGIRAALGDAGAAQAHYRDALVLDPINLAATANLAGLLVRDGRLEEGLALDRAAVALAPANGSVRLNLGFTLMRLGRLPEAEAACLEALDLDPGNPLARWNLAYIRLLQGRYREAWADFPARLEVPRGLDNLRGFAEPAWDGSPFPGRTLLVWVEQGLGDTLQFARYLPRARALGGTVIFQTYACLRGVLGDLPGADLIVTEADPLPPFDLQVPLLELPALFGDGVEDLPPPAPLGPPPGHVPPPELLAALAGPEPKVGLVWAGSAHHQDDARRSLDPALLAPLGAIPGIRWMSLQVGGPPPPPLPGLRDLGRTFRDFSDTAAALAGLDLLITVDTSVAHLAGSMGVPTCLLLPYLPDWRWLMEGEACPWYSSVRLLRQPAPGAWGPALARVAESLNQLMNNRRGTC